MYFIGGILFFGFIGALFGGPVGALLGIGLIVFVCIQDIFEKREAKRIYESNQQKNTEYRKVETKVRLPSIKFRPLPPGAVCFSWHDSNIIKMIFQQQTSIKNDYELRLQVAEVFIKHDINCLYHITDKKNYETIKKSGCILSRRNLNRENISYVSGGGELSIRLDDRHNLDSYIHLCFNPYLPMFWKMLYEQNRELVVFKINPAIATLSTVLFSDKNAVDNTAINATYDKGGLDNLNFADIFSIYSYGEPTDVFKHRQSEILVPNIIPKEFIINFDNPQELDSFIFDSHNITRPDYYCPFSNQKYAVAFDDKEYQISVPIILDTLNLKEPESKKIEDNSTKSISVNESSRYKYQPTTKEQLKGLVENERIYLGDIDVSKITDMSNLFEDTSRVNFDGIEKWNVSNVTNMCGMFYKALHFNSDISQWDVSKVTNMNSMFREAANFNSDLSEWDVSKVSAMALMFCGAAKFNSDLSKWDVSNVTDMSYMFGGASNFNSDLSQWKVVTECFILGMFDNARCMELPWWYLEKIDEYLW